MNKISLLWTLAIAKVLNINLSFVCFGDYENYKFHKNHLKNMLRDRKLAIKIFDGRKAPLDKIRYVDVIKVIK